MTRVSLHTSINLPWTNILPVRVGEVPDGLGTPDIFVLVEADGETQLRIDIYVASEECLAFQEALEWNGFVVVGCGSRVYLVALDSQRVQSYSQEGYFGHLYTTDECLLMASATCLSCVGSDGRLVWKTEPLGIDGVIVDDIRSETIHGQGEWDPPGGWKPFAVDLRTGSTLPDNH